MLGMGRTIIGPGSRVGEGEGVGNLGSRYTVTTLISAWRRCV